MTRLKLSLAACAFLLATGTAFVSHGFTAGWYEPNYPQDQTANAAPPAECIGEVVLCSTKYNSAGMAIDTRYLPD